MSIGPGQHIPKERSTAQSIREHDIGKYLQTRLIKDDQASALLEFAVTLPLLVVFVVGIFDFSGAFNQRQKLAQAAQEGAIFAASQPTSDIYSGNANPDSLQPIVTVVFKSLADSGVLAGANTGTCRTSNANPSQTGALEWTYVISGCPAHLTLIVNRGWAPAVPDLTKTVGTLLTVTYPYTWHFNSAIQLLFPGVSYSLPINLSETAKVQNQL